MATSLNADLRPPRTAWFEQFAHAAFAAKGVLYLATAAVAARTDLSSTFARVLVATLGLGLICAAAYKFVEAFAHPDVRRRGGDVFARRVERIVAAIVYSVLAVVALEHVLGVPSGQIHWTARVLERWYGPIFFSSVGLVVIGFGLLQLYRAFTSECLRRLDQGRMSGLGRKLVAVASTIAYGGRGAAVVAFGAVLIDASVTFDPRVNADGLPGMINNIDHTSGGLWLLTIAIVGLAAYGAYCLLVAARYSTLTETPCVR